MRYLNTDLEIISRGHPARLIAALEQRALFSLQVVRSRNGSWRTTLETVQQCDVAEASLRVFLNAIESLEAGPRELWQRCTSRQFNIGYETGSDRTVSHKVSKRQVKRMAAVGASLEMTIYEAHEASSLSKLPTKGSPQGQGTAGRSGVAAWRHGKVR